MNPSPYPSPFYSARYKSAHSRAVVVKILLMVGAVAAGLLIVSEALFIALPPITDDPEATDSVASIVVAIVMFLIAILTILLYIATVITFCIWLYRSYDNLKAFGHSALDHSPGWAVGSFFVPILNLFVPYRAVKEVWQKSVPPDEEFMSAPLASPPASFPLWWMFWIIGSIVGNISTRMTFTEGVDEGVSTMVSITAGVLSIISAILATVVINSIDQRQEETSSKLRLGKFSSPPPVPPPPPQYQPMTDAVMPQ